MDDTLKVQEKYYILTLEKRVQELTKDNLMSQAMIMQLMEENQKLIELYNSSQNKQEDVKEKEGK